MRKKEEIVLTKFQSFMLFVFYLMMFTFIAAGGYYFYSDLHIAYFVDKSITIDTGNTYQISLLPKNSKYFDYSNYVFEVSDPEVIEVNENGQITSLKEGTSELSVKYKYGFEKDTISVTVQDIDVKSLELEDNLVISVNSTTRIKLKINGQENIGTSLTYTSYDSSIAKVDNYGNITGLKEGSTIIGVKSNNDIEKKAKITVKANNIEIQQISFTRKDITLKKGEKKQLEVYTTPSNASIKELEWKSSNKNVATVDSNGIVTAKEKGYAVISITTNNGLTSQITVYVNVDDELVINKYNIELEVGSTDRITANVPVSYFSNNKSVATVDSTGKVTAVSAGRATIEVKASNGKRITCEVIVRNKVIKVESVSLNKDSATMNVGDTLVLNATILPNNATNKDIEWTSSNKSIANVDQTGKVSAVSTGTVTITAQTSNGKNDNCTITVKPLEVSKIEIDRSNFSLDIGSNITLKINFYPTGSTSSIKWTSSDSGIAKVDQNGKVTGVKEGSATITATTSNNLKATSKVNVIKNTVSVTSVKLDKTTASINIGSTLTLKATITPSDASNKTLEWKSSNTNVATVDQSGKVTAKGVGTADIEVKTNNGKTAKCSITVKAIEVTSIELDKTSTSVNIGSSVTLKATVKPDNATNKKLTWSSSNTSVATVDQNGKVTGVSKGTVDITVKSNNGKTAKCSVTVNEIAVKTIELNKTEVTLTEGNTTTLSATIKPDNATNKTVTWSSNNTSIVTVDQKGKITAVKAGTTKIVVTSKSNSSVKAEAIITVKAKEIAVTGISLNKTTATLYVGDFLLLDASFTPCDATNQTVTWTSNNTSVATVDSVGRVKGLKEGTATITAKSYNNKTATAKITVVKKTVGVTSVIIDNNITSMYVGDTVTLSTTISPSNATNKAITWSSSNTSVATVDQSGKVTALKSGSVTITATSNSNNKISDSITIAINEKKVPVTKLTAKVTSKTLIVNKTYKWSVTVEPSDATNKNIAYTSADKKIATVDSTGKITAVKAGTVTITAKSKENNSIKTTIKITVRTGEDLDITKGINSKKYNDKAYYEVIPPHPTTNMPLVVYVAPSGFFNSTSSDAPTKYINSKKAYDKEEFIFITISTHEYTDIKKVIDYVVKEYKCDKSRISVAGFSMGSLRTWELVNANPKYFSAAVPISNGPYYAGGKNYYNIQAKNFKYTKVWGYAGDKDGEANGWEGYSAGQIKAFVKEINNIGGSAKFTQYKNKNHAGMAYTISNKDILNWMIEQKNPNVK